jgi:hypothetical protein
MRFLKTFVVLLSLSLVVPAGSALAEPVLNGRPSLAIAGTIRPDVSADILAMTS